MQEFIKPLFPIGLSAICAFFALQLLLGVSGISNLIFDHTDSSFSPLYIELPSPSTEALPDLKYTGKALTVGESVHFPSLFALSYADETITTASEDKRITLYLLDIKNADDISQLTFYNSLEEAELEEIPSIAIYDIQNSKLTFYKSGIYTVYLRMYFENQPGLLYEFDIPVEVN